MDVNKKTETNLEVEILVAHQNNDGLKLAELYAEAAYNSSNSDKACFLSLIHI